MRWWRRIVLSKTPRVVINTEDAVPGSLGAFIFADSQKKNTLGDLVFGIKTTRNGA